MKPETHSDGAISFLIRHLIEHHEFSERSVREFFERKTHAIPLCIFNAQAGTFETVVKYLHEHEDLKLSEIARMFKRSPKTVWSTYTKAKRKLSSEFVIEQPTLMIPLSVFQYDERSHLENIVHYLHEQGMSAKIVAGYLHRSVATVYTVLRKLRTKQQ